MFPSVDPANVGITGLLWLVLSYGFVLFYASNLISGGSDLLLLVPSLAGLVGGVVLPLLGAVPDGAIMLFSGIGSIEEAQETLSVGVGALAGSTIMLLTVPWSMSVMAGRVDIRPELKGDGLAYLATPKLTAKASLKDHLFNTGVSLSPEVKHGGIVMLLTMIPYLIIQLPASFLHGPSDVIAKGEKWWALFGLIVCVSSFTMYLIVHLRASKNDEEKMKRLEVIKDMLKQGTVSLSGAFYDIIQTYGADESLSGQDYGSVSNGNRHPVPVKVREYLSEILKEPFKHYDVDGSNGLQKSEIRKFFSDLKEDISEAEVNTLFTIYDVDGNGVICFDEFIDICYSFMRTDRKPKSELDPEGSLLLKDFTAVAVDTLKESDEEEEVPHDIAHLSPQEQQRAIKRKAFTMLFFGTALVLVFSDPMVACLQEIASRCHISPFYVSFVLSPVASNASEVIASTYYATKKTRKSISVSFSALEGAACMNNTFCLSIFMGLIFFRGLAWEYTAETITIIVVQLSIFVVTRKDKMSLFTGLMVLLMFPLSIALVAILEMVFHLK